MSTKKLDQSAIEADLELTDDDLDNVTGGPGQFVTLDGIEGEAVDGNRTSSSPSSPASTTKR
jgi:hypothetical protein